MLVERCGAAADDARADARRRRPPDRPSAREARRAARGRRRAGAPRGRESASTSAPRTAPPSSGRSSGWREFCRLLAARGRHAGAARRAERCGGRRRASSSAAPAASLVGRDRPALLPALLAELDVLVSGDTGVAHLAAALGTPVVTLFGPTDPRADARRAAAPPSSRTRCRARRASTAPARSSIRACAGSSSPPTCARAARWRLLRGRR